MPRPKTETTKLIQLTLSEDEAVFLYWAATAMICQQTGKILEYMSIMLRFRELTEHDYNSDVTWTRPTLERLTKLITATWTVEQEPE